MAATRAHRRRRRRKGMGRDDLRRHLAPTATIRERVEGLLAVGLSAAELSEVTRTTESTVRNWVAGDTEPRPDAEMALDYLRAVAKALLDGGMAPDRALRWLMSLDPDRFGTERPIDVLRTTPMRVLSAALDVTLDEPGVVV